MSDYIWC